MLPVISLTAADAPSQIALACEDVGFFAVIDHGIELDVLSAVWRTAGEFFDLSEQEKAAVQFPYPGYPHGYSPLAYERLSSSIGRATPADLKESLAIGPITHPRHHFTDPDESIAWSPNQWPRTPADLRPAWEAAYSAFSALAARLLADMAAALGLERTWFEPLIDRHTSAMRALNYPMCDRQDSDQQRAGAHTDYGTLTILMADPDVAGLQVQRSNGDWMDVSPPPFGTLIVNLGDAMERWTNDRWRSTMHRVVLAAARRRSVAFFHNANWDAMIECLPGCADGKVSRHPPMAAGPHLMAKFRATVSASDPGLP